MAPSSRAGEDISMRRRRLRYRAWHRGTRELDLLLGPYTDAEIDRMGPVELDRLERLLGHEETDLQAWLLSSSEPPPGVDRELLDRIITHKTSTS